MRTLNKREQLLAGGVGVLGLLFLVQIVIIRPFTKKLGEFPLQSKREELLLKSSLAMQNSKDRIATEYERYKSYMRSPASSQEGMAEFLQEIEQAAKDSGIEIVSLAPQGTGEDEYQVRLKGESDVGGIFDFLHAIEESKLLMGIEMFSINTKHKEQKILTFDAVLTRSFLENLTF